MTDNQLIAGKINNLGYGEAPDESTLSLAKTLGIVIIFGYSDDLMEFRGAVDDEMGCYDGGIAFFNKNGWVHNKCDADDCPYALENEKRATPVEALWCKEENYSWTYKTDIPHEIFEVLEDGESYCRGIVFKLSDIN